MRFTGIFFIFLALGISSCSKVDNAIQGTTNAVLNVSTAAYTIAVGNSVTLDFSGGKSPYTFEIRSGSGTIDSNGKYTATSVGTAVVAIKDSRNQEQLVTITVNNTISSSLSQAISYTGYTTSISPFISGGVPPYQFSVLSGTGYISSSGFYTGATGTDVVKVSDSLNNSTSLQIKNYTKPLIDIDFTQTFVANPLFTMVGGSTRGAFFNSSGVLETPSTANQLRIGHDPITKRPLGMLIESQNTQHILRSELFNHATWVKTGVTVLADQLIAPDGLNSVDMIYESAGVSEHSIEQSSLAVNTSIYYTWSVYVKKLNQRWVALSVFDTNPVAAAWFDLDNGVWGTTAGVYRAHPAENVGNGFYRISITAKPNATPATFRINLANSNGGSLSYNGDVTKGVYIWGAQVNGDSANWMGVITSYKQTAGATVTSTDDRVDLTDFQKWFNYSEGTLLTNILSTQHSRLSNTVFSLGDNSFATGNAYTISRDSTMATQSSFLISNASVDQVNIHSGASWTSHEYHRLLSSYKTTTGASFYDNGIQIGSSSGAFTMPAFTRGRLGQPTAQNNYIPLAGYFNRLSYWATKLSDAQLEELSSGLTMIPSISLARTQFDKALNGATLDLSQYVTGGTSPYTYTHSGAGSLNTTTGVFTPSTAGAAVVTVTDSNGNAAKFDINVIGPSVEFDFTRGSLNSLDGNYAITFTRASTATYFDVNGVMRTAAVNEPRYDHDPKTHTALGLLVEMNKTNLITDSQVDQWTPEQLTVTANHSNAPDGTTTADKIVATAAFPRARIGFTAVASTKYVLSVYAKMLVGTNVSLMYEDSGNIYRVAFNGTTGAMVSTAGAGATPTYGKQDIGGGWFRLWISVEAPSTTGNFWIIPGLYDGAVPTEEILVWGAQVETGSAPSSYIPTAGATVTRQWDLAQETTVGWLTQGKGTFQAIASQPYEVNWNTDQYAIATLWVTSNDSIYLYKTDATVSAPNKHRSRVRIRSSSTEQIHISVGSVWTPGVATSVGMAYGKNYVRGNATGGTVDDFDATVASPVVRLCIGTAGNAGGAASSRVFDGHFRSFRYWPYRMLNEDLAILVPQ